MAVITLTAQNVNGDPALNGGNINITNGGTTELVFNDIDGALGPVAPGETVSIDGGTTFLSYDFLGYGDVRGDPNQTAGFIRVDMGDGTFETFAIDMNDDGNYFPDLANGNTKLAVFELDNASSAPYPVPPCFVEGTLIATDRGLRAVETIRPGQRVLTRDNGFQEVVWHGARTISGRGRFAPIRFASGAVQNDRPLLVSPQHRVLVTGWRPQTFFGTKEVLVAAKDMVNADTISRAPCDQVTYHHLLFETHQIVRSEGAWTESFLPGDHILSSNPGILQELRALFPDMAVGANLAVRTAARYVTTGKEALLLH